MRAIFKREFRSYFTTPIGYIVLAAFYFFLGLYFSILYSAGSPDINAAVLAMATVTVFAMPILTMRLMSDDRRQKVDQALITAPVKLSAIVFGKFFSAFVVYAIGFAPTVIFQIIVLTKVTVNVMPYIYSLIGIMLLGGVLISIGMFISCLTESPVISGILTLVINILVLYMSNFASMVKVAWISTILKKLAFITVLDNFGENIFSVSDIVYFISIITVFLFLSVRSLEKRRWA